MLMPIADTLLPEFDHEMAGTRRMLEAVPAADAAWKPHPKSSPLGDLAAHIATLPLWGRLTLERTELDLGIPANAALAGAPFTTTPELVERFDRNVRDARAALAAATDADMAVTWTLKNAGTTILSMPRAAVLRGFVLSHMIHHRAQLSVYLRLRDVPLPSLYGPTADTRR
ncbi:MAG: DinB family protein [Gemmatimonadales bacterium]